MITDMRVVLDTNVLIDGFNDDFSAQAKIIEAILNGELEAIVTPAIVREYRNILRRLINDAGYKERVADFLSMAKEVTPVRVEEEIDDPDDYKFLQAAVGGGASAIITNDRHLLDVGELGHIKVMTPQECWTVFQEDSGGDGEWESFMRNLGIGN